MIGRDPERWRLDAMGNPVCRALRGCMGPLCHEYDHVLPFSKGGKTEINNCQILQTTLNRVKSNRVDISYNELKTISPTINFSGTYIQSFLKYSLKKNRNLTPLKQQFLEISKKMKSKTKNYKITII